MQFSFHTECMNSMIGAGIGCNARGTKLVRANPADYDEDPLTIDCLHNQSAKSKCMQKMGLYKQTLRSDRLSFLDELRLNDVQQIFPDCYTFTVKVTV